MSDPTIPPQLCDDRTTHEPHQWLDSDKGNPKNHTWWCPGIHYFSSEDDVVTTQIRDEFKERIGIRIQTMQDDISNLSNIINIARSKIRHLDDNLSILKMELGE